MDKPESGIDLWRIAAGEVIERALSQAHTAAGLAGVLKTHPQAPALQKVLLDLCVHLEKNLELLAPFLASKDGEKVPVISRCIFNRVGRAANSLGELLQLLSTFDGPTSDEIRARVISARLDLLDLPADEMMGRIAVLADPPSAEARPPATIAGAYPEG